MTEKPKALLPFLKWAGGKRWLSASLAPIVAQCRGTYFEPFLGSGAVFFHHQPRQAVLSDANAELIECYVAIRDEPSAVQQALKRLAGKDPETSYYDVRKSRPRSVAGRAARFLYLNRTCWNGLYRVNLKGEFNVPRGTKTQILLPDEDFFVFSAVLQSCRISACDFEESIDAAKDGDLIFADPPYTVAHNLNGFVKYNQQIFSWCDQKRLAAALIRASRRGVMVISTNADHPEVLALYRNHFSTDSVARSSVIAAASSNRRRTTELLILNSEARLS